MTRREKYSDTDTFTLYNANPKNRYTGDCMYRAICTALKRPYREVVMEMAELCCNTGYWDMELICRYMELNGWIKNKQPRKSDGRKYTGKEFCKKIAQPGKRYLANIGGGHIVAIINCKLLDTWDSTDGCIGNYWSLPDVV